MATTLDGTLEKITYSNEETGWSVVKLSTPGRRASVTAVGNLLGVQPGESLHLQGQWVTDRKYGEQFRVDSYVTVQPATLLGIEKYLSSGLVRGIGKGLAKRLVKQFGLETLDLIENDPDRLTEVEGIGPVRSNRIRDAWEEQREIKSVMLFLQSHEVSTAHAIRIYREYKERAIAVVKENPYRLALDIFGIGFLTADRIAGNLGIEKDSPRRAEAGTLHILGEMSDQGHIYAPRDLLTEAAAKMLDVEVSTIDAAIDRLSRDAHLIVETLPDGQMAVFLSSLHTAESGAADLLKEIMATPVKPISIDIERALSWFEKQRGIELAEAQREAIRRAISSKVLVITGGPGTGKTTLVNGIIQILGKKNRKILLTAPTGRAAKRMNETTGHEAKTIHRLLEFSPKKLSFERGLSNPLVTDMVVVDEISMVDTVLAYSLLKAIPTRAQLVLVGDVDQLPSVGPGSVLRDLIRSERIDVVRLKEIFRQAEESRIIVNAHRVNEGRQPLIENDDDADFFFIERDEPEDVLTVIKDLIVKRIPRRFGLDPIDEIQVLTPMHKGLLGATNLNAELQTILNSTGKTITRGSRTFRVGDKVLQIRNNYDLEVFNGDIGRILSIDEVERQVSIRYDDRQVLYDYADLDELALAYACSIHKAQGSEYPGVVIPIHTQHYVMLQRNLLYTGITRGRRLVVLVGNRRALAIAVKNRRIEKRFTRLADRLMKQPGG